MTELISHVDLWGYRSEVCYTLSGPFLHAATCNPRPSSVDQRLCDSHLCVPGRSRPVSPSVAIRQNRRSSKEPRGSLSSLEEQVDRASLAGLSSHLDPVCSYASCSRSWLLASMEASSRRNHIALTRGTAVCRSWNRAADTEAHKKTRCASLGWLSIGQ